MSERVVYNLDKILNRNKNRSYRESIMRDAKTLMLFLRENNLISINPFDEYGNLIKELIVKETDLTEDGLKLFDGPVIKWWNYIDRGGKPENTGHLEKGLKNLRQKIEK